VVTVRPPADPRLLAALQAMAPHERVARLRGLLARSAILGGIPQLLERARQRGVLADVRKAVLGHRGRR
jgi:hypothetical protein